jgi:hypothetical protein
MVGAIVAVLFAVMGSEVVEFAVAVSWSSWLAEPLTRRVTTTVIDSPRSSDADVQVTVPRLPTGGAAHVAPDGAVELTLRNVEVVVQLSLTATL